MQGRIQRQNRMKIPTPLILSFGLVAALPAGAQIVASFDSGTGTGTSNEFVGAAGGGWVGAWAQNTRTPSPPNTTSASQTLTAVNPLGGSGSLLVTSFTANTSGGATRSNARREWTAFGGANPANAFVVSFDFRVDEITGTNASGDFVQFFLRGTSQTSTDFNLGAAGIRILGDGTLQYRNGSSTVSVAPATYAIADGTVYTFSAEVDPTTATWDLSVFQTSNPSNAFSIAGLGFGSTGSGTNDGVTWLHFGTSVNASAAAGFTGATSTWTVDNISIIPEPSTYAALLGGAALGLGLLRRRRC